VEKFFASPHLVDLVLVVVALEAVVLIGLRRGLMRTIVLLLPGVCLMLALRAALAGAAWPWVPLALAAAFMAHIADVHDRWRD
jgi:hypothetical protein